MYNSPFNIYSPQASLDRINAQINELEKAKAQYQQQPVQQPITQNFQLAPTNHDAIRYANSLEEVQRNVVIGDTPYFSKDMSVVWVKDTRGNIRTYELTEIVPKDAKDMQIEMLKAEIDELKKGMITNEQPNTNVIQPENAINTTRNDETDGTTVENEKSSSIQKISTSKKGK